MRPPVAVLAIFTSALLSSCAHESSTAPSTTINEYDRRQAYGSGMVDCYHDQGYEASFDGKEIAAPIPPGMSAEEAQAIGAECTARNAKYAPDPIDTEVELRAEYAHQQSLHDCLTELGIDVGPMVSLDEFVAKKMRVLLPYDYVKPEDFQRAVKSCPQI